MYGKLHGSKKLYKQWSEKQKHLHSTHRCLRWFSWARSGTWVCNKGTGRKGGHQLHLPRRPCQAGGAEAGKWDQGVPSGAPRAGDTAAPSGQLWPDKCTLAQLSPHSQWLPQPKNWVFGLHAYDGAHMIGLFLSCSSSYHTPSSLLFFNVSLKSEEKKRKKMEQYIIQKDIKVLGPPFLSSQLSPDSLLSFHCSRSCFYRTIQYYK